MTEQELINIEKKCQEYEYGTPDPQMLDDLALYIVPTLIAEIRDLKAEMQERELLKEANRQIGDAA